MMTEPVTEPPGAEPRFETPYERVVRTLGAFARTLARRAAAPGGDIDAAR